MKHAKFRKVMLGLAASTAALVVGAAAFTGKASATTCSQSWVCFYTHSNYGGSSYAHYNPNHAACYGIPSSYNDTFSSVRNITYGRLFMYRDAGCTGIPYVLDPMHAQPSFHWSWNDTISSYQVFYW